jgi:predicted ATP-dependent endonuclease of OLD family
MKICKIYLRDFEQFQNVDLDFTHPETGEPLDKICFIGSNGTGKSKILKVIKWCFLEVLPNIRYDRTIILAKDAKIILKVLHQDFHYLIFPFQTQCCLLKISSLNPAEEIKLINNLFTLKNVFEFHARGFFDEYTLKSSNNEFLDDFEFSNNSNDLFLHSPSESSSNGYKDIVDVPITTVSEALEFSNSFPFQAEVSSEYVNVFWKLLVYNLRKRAEEKDDFENQPSNLIRIKQDLINEFDGFYPKVLDKLGDVWNKILDKAGLYFDVKGASNPYQLNDNLKAYIKLKSTNEIVPYGELSTGIRNYIFRLGHIFSLYFNREIDRGFLLVDEPENSLFPDFLFDLMDTYKNVIIDKREQNNTQVFFATHNPIVAAQFQPYERVILEWKEDGSVKASSGVAPEGDDPNDLLKKDFGIRELMGSAGLEKWEYYRSLKRKLKQSEEIEDKMNIASEINKLGQLYNFPA